jgi:hypothetical protein
MLMFPNINISGPNFPNPTPNAPGCFKKLGSVASAKHIIDGKGHPAALTPRPGSNDIYLYTEYIPVEKRHLPNPYKRVLIAHGNTDTGFKAVTIDQESFQGLLTRHGGNDRLKPLWEVISSLVHTQDYIGNGLGTITAQQILDITGYSVTNLCP